MNSRLSSTTHFEPLKKGETRLDYYFCLGDRTLVVTYLIIEGKKCLADTINDFEL